MKTFYNLADRYEKNSNGVLLSSKWEGMPNILLQSLYLNKPVLSTNCNSGPMELKNFMSLMLVIYLVRRNFQVLE